MPAVSKPLLPPLGQSNLIPFPTFLPILPSGGITSGGEQGDGTRGKKGKTGNKRNSNCGFVLVCRIYLYPPWLGIALGFVKSLQKHPAWHPTHDRNVGPGSASAPQPREAPRSFHRCLSNFKIRFGCVELMEFVMESSRRDAIPVN